MVSILVLLDVALKAENVIGFSRVSEWSFNPCSLGCCSESVAPGTDAFQIPSFNPCSLGCCSERSVKRSNRASPAWSFNPCSLGCCSERAVPRTPQIDIPGVSILVLLDVALKDCAKPSGSN